MERQFPFFNLFPRRDFNLKWSVLEEMRGRYQQVVSIHEGRPEELLSQPNLTHAVLA